VNGVTVRFFQNTTKSSRSVPAEIQDSLYRLEMDNDLLNIEDENAVDISSYGTSIYLLPRAPQLVQATQGSQIIFKIRPHSLSNTTWTIFGARPVGSRTITTKIKCTGLNSGLSSTITVT